MATDVLMPKLSDTMEEGKILKWLKQPGDRVKAGDLLAEVETDKADMEIESFDDGVLAEVKAAEGDTVAVGAVIAVLSDGGAAAAPVKPAAKAANAAETGASPEPSDQEPSGETSSTAPAGEAKPAAAAPPAKPAPAAAKAAPAAAKPAPAAPKPAPAAAKPAAPAKAPPPAEESTVADGVRSSPLARKIAAERGVDLAGVTGTGPGGRIVQKDVEAAAGGGERPAPAEARAPAAASREGDVRTELSRIRKTTAKRMAEAKREIPHFYASADLDADALLRCREGLVHLGGDFEGLTVTHLLLKACGLALARVPEMNASLDGDAVTRHARANVGIATATDQGLLVPVVPDCDTAPLATVVASARGVVERARRGKPAGNDLSGATFTLSNLGMYPVSHFAAVVNPPQAGILAVGTVREIPVVRAGAVVPGHVMTVTLSCDHRVVDGAIAGRFLAALKDLVEQPLALVV